MNLVSSSAGGFRHFPLPPKSNLLLCLWQAIFSYKSIALFRYLSEMWKEKEGNAIKPLSILFRFAIWSLISSLIIARRTQKDDG